MSGYAFSALQGKHRAANRNQDRVNQAVLAGESDLPQDEATDYGAQNAKENVPDNRIP